MCADTTSPSVLTPWCDVWFRSASQGRGRRGAPEVGIGFFLRASLGPVALPVTAAAPGAHTTMSEPTQALIINGAVLIAVLESDLGRHRKIGRMRILRQLLTAGAVVPLFIARPVTHGTGSVLAAAARPPAGPSAAPDCRPPCCGSS
jgi:hypothetical protein